MVIAIQYFPSTIEFLLTFSVVEYLITLPGQVSETAVIHAVKGVQTYPSNFNCCFIERNHK